MAKAYHQFWSMLRDFYAEDASFQSFNLQRGKNEVQYFNHSSMKKARVRIDEFFVLLSGSELQDRVESPRRCQNLRSERMKRWKNFQNWKKFQNWKNFKCEKNFKFEKILSVKKFQVWKKFKFEKNSSLKNVVII